MMKNFIKILSIAIFGTVLFSCSDNVNQYIPADMVYIVNSGTNPVTLFNTGENNTYNLGIYRAGKHGKAGYVKVAVMSDSELSEYNQENETSFMALPSEYYTLQATEVNFGGGVADTNASIPIEFNTPALQDFFEANPSNVYVLPIKIASSSLEIQEKKNMSMIQLTVDEPAIVMTVTGKDEYSYAAGETVSSINMKLGVALDFDNKWDISCQIGVSQEALDNYNDENGTYYLMLPSDLYTLAPNPVVIAEGTKKAEFQLNIDGSKLPEGSYMLPIYIESTSKFKVDPNENLYMLCINIEAPVLDNSGYKVIYGTTQEPVNEGKNGKFENLFDGDLDSFWHSKWGSDAPGYPANPPLPHDLLIDMGSVYTITQIDLARRMNNSATKAGEFYVTSDDAFALVNAGKYDDIQWTKVGNFFMDTVNGYQSFPIFSSTTRYVLVKITESRNGSVTSLAGIQFHGFQD